MFFFSGVHIVYFIGATSLLWHPARRPIVVCPSLNKTDIRAQAFQQLQQNFVAFMLTIMAHFFLGFRPILVLQIFSTPYYYIENRLLRKYVLGLKPGFRIWGERFEGELGQGRIVKTAVNEPAEGDGDAIGPGGNDAAATPVGEVVPAAEPPVVEVRGKGIM